MENLLAAWEEFERGKRAKSDVQEFKRYLLYRICTLQRELATGTYRHGVYAHFKISDPKPRDIHKAAVRDRLLHHAIYRRLYPSFDSLFIADSYSCRDRKGSHRALNRFRTFARRVSGNGRGTCWVLKCDIRKFFASVDQDTLREILRARIEDSRILDLLENIIASFNSGTVGKGLPLGNLTSQLLVNIYMNEFDQFAKHILKARQYIRYADDFVFLSQDRLWLESLLPRIRDFLRDHLNLELHPNKVSIQTLASGVDFLGWVHFPDHRVLRTATKKRMFRRLRDQAEAPETVASYRGLLSHGNTRKLQARIESLILPPS